MTPQTGTYVLQKLKKEIICQFWEILIFLIYTGVYGVCIRHFFRMCKKIVTPANNEP